MKNNEDHCFANFFHFIRLATFPKASFLSITRTNTYLKKDCSVCQNYYQLRLGFLLANEKDNLELFQISKSSFNPNHKQFVVVNDESESINNKFL